MVLLACVTNKLLVCGTTRCRLFQKKSKHHYFFIKIISVFRKIREMFRPFKSLSSKALINIKGVAELISLCYLKPVLTGDIPLFRYEIPLCYCNSIIPKAIQSKHLLLSQNSFCYHSNSLPVLTNIRIIRRGPGSSVCIATELRAERSGDRIPVGRDFPPVQTGPEAHPASCIMVIGSFPGIKYGRGVLMTPNPFIVPESKNRVELYLCSP